MQDPLSGAPVTFVYVADRDRAKAFYCETLGLKLQSSDDHGDSLDLGGGSLHITVVADHKAGEHPVMGWNVPDIAAAAKALRDRGVVFAIYEGWGQNELGIWSSPDGKTHLAFFADPEGNMLTLSQG